MFKNVTLLPTTKDGQKIWKLLGPDGNPIPAFDIFAVHLLSAKLNTRIAYSRHVAAFLDYMFEAYDRLQATDPAFEPTTLRLRKVIEEYNDYLTLGTDSGKPIAALVSASLPSPRCSTSSAALANAAVRRFLNLSEDIRSEMEELATLRLADGHVDGLPLFPEMGKKVAISVSQRQQMMSKSLLAGVISGGPKFLKSVSLPTSVPRASKEDDRAFPFDRIVDFIEALPSHQAKSRYAFCAASGCREGESLQLLMEDIDFTSGKVLLIDPKSRVNHPSYRNLLPEERDQLEWKGRTTSACILIEPFASIFFEQLEKYLKHEYIPHGLHSFIFQYQKGKLAGRPYFLTAKSTRQEVFKTALRKENVKLRIDGPHSLRGAFATYLLNYFPRSDGSYGLALPVVQQLLGHADINSTKRYARYDADLIALELKHANAMIYNGAQPKKLVDLKLEMLRHEIRKIEMAQGDAQK